MTCHIDNTHKTARLPIIHIYSAFVQGQLSLPSLRVSKSSTACLVRVKAGCVQLRRLAGNSV